MCEMPLSFESREKKKLNMWCVDASGLTYQQQNVLGEAMAREASAYIRKTGETYLLGWIARDQQKGEFDGVAVGFWSAIAEMVYRQ